MSKYQRTIDHVIPLSRGGLDTLKNKVWACRSCNSQKKNHLPEEWLMLLKEKLGKAKSESQMLRIKKQINSVMKYAGQ
jgi:5-methylcytosine-specific restriction endonuclease McrA